ncbi:hypothetical protein [Haloarcula nitratireducens]|uniref:Uncharacterized protein n=1 Tax=Haloarcula nitratireducens TaxID=2487749 RepID=A0AAW4PJ98_9EURY|nr:hypothetical protein [Halomicroarcula nitratireducens]MBX0298039.1 hypothetical protein [Halomicroarcula nitratireducens]
MTDRNPEFDPADIRGTASSDPETANANREALSGNYPGDDGVAEDSGTCRTCWRETLDGRPQCPFCAQNGVAEPTVEGGDGAEWSFGRVVIAVVEAQSKYHARALGAAAFAVSNDLTTDAETRADVKCRAAFDTEPAPQLTTGWPPLPDAVRIDAAVAQTILSTAVEKTEWDDVQTKPVLFVEDGDGLEEYSEFDALETLLAENDEDYWLVPGIVQRYAVKESADIASKFYCVACQEPMPHSYAGRDGIGSYPVAVRAIWTCDACGQPRFVDDVASKRDQESPREWVPEGVSYEDAHAGEPLPHEREFDQQITDYYERHERYPWQ